MSDIATRTDRLAQLEEIISYGFHWIVRTGQALKEIRDAKLYQEAGHPSFEHYCEQRWNISRPHAYRLIDAGEVMEALSPTGDKPQSERQTRELAQLKDEPEEMAEAWAEAVEEHGDPTAEQVREVVQRKKRPDPDLCPRCEETKPLEAFRRRNGSLAKWCDECRALDQPGNPAVTEGTPANLSDMLSKWQTFAAKLHEQRDKYGSDLSQYAQGQMFVADEVVKDLRAVVSGTITTSPTWTA